MSMKFSWSSAALCLQAGAAPSFYKMNCFVSKNIFFCPAVNTTVPSVKVHPYSLIYGLMWSVMTDSAVRTSCPQLKKSNIFLSPCFKEEKGSHNNDCITGQGEKAQAFLLRNATKQTWIPVTFVLNTSCNSSSLVKCTVRWEKRRWLIAIILLHSLTWFLFQEIFRAVRLKTRYRLGRKSRAAPPAQEVAGGRQLSSHCE